MIRYFPFLFLFASIASFAGNSTYIKGPTLIESLTTTVTAASDTTLTVSSNTNQEFTGTTTQNVVLPDATTLAVGRRFNIWNRSTGILTVKNNGAATLTTIGAGLDFQILLIANGTTNGTWSYKSGGVLSVSEGGTGASTLTANNVILGNTTSAVQFVAPGTSGNLLTSNGTTWQSTAPAAAAGKAAGELFMFAGTTCPAQSVEADGSSLLRSGTYANLFAAISTAHGTADGTHFNLPDLRGKFVRGWSHGTTNDPDKASRTGTTGGATGDNVGSLQGDATKKNGLALSDPGHSHGVTTYEDGGVSGYIGAGTSTPLGSASTESASSGVTLGSGDNETRPKNVNILYCVQY